MLACCPYKLSSNAIFHKLHLGVFSWQCGSTNIQKSLLTLVNDASVLAALGPNWSPHQVVPGQGRRYHLYSISRTGDLTQTVTSAKYRVMYVRHPFRRLVSAYRYENNHFYSDFIVIRWPNRDI